MAPRSPWDQAFFAERRLTSKLKHLVLERYMREFAYHLGSVHSTVYYVDGFAGPGIYQRPGGRSEKGSPLLIAELAQRISGTDAPFRLRCLNVEEDETFHKDLELATVPFHPHIVENNYCGSFTAVLPDILQRVGQSPTFFFIDPFGTKGIPFAGLRPIFQRAARTEVLITLHTDGISKKAGYFRSVDAPDPRKAQTATRYTEGLAAALDIPWDQLRSWWKECVEGGQGGTTEFEQRVLLHYLKALRSPKTRFKFSKAFPVFYYRHGEPPGTRDPVCFYLVFGTQHKKGLYKMNDRMLDAVDDFYKDEYAQTFFPQFREQLEKTRDVAALEQEILTRFTKRSFTIDEAKLHLMQETKFLVKGSDYRNAIIGLCKAGFLERLKAGPISNEHTRFSRQDVKRPN